MKTPHLKADAGEWIFDETGVGGMYRKWAAFTQIVFFDRIKHNET